VNGKDEPMGFELPNHTDPLTTLTTIRGLLGGDGADSLCTEIDEEIRKVRARRFYLAVVGQFKRGKSTFINALLGEQLLPVGVLPLTAVVTLLSYDTEQQIQVHFQDGTSNEVERSSLPGYVTEQGNPNNQKKVTFINIGFPSPILKHGVVLIDTPGIGSLFSHNTRTTREFIPRIDAAVFVLSADPPITEAEYEFLDELVQHVGKVFVVLNKVDTLTESEITQTVEYTQSAIFPKLRGTAVFTVSALRALEAKLTANEELLVESGMTKFCIDLDKFMLTEKRDVLLQRSAQRTEMFLSRAKFQIELERKAALTPLDALQSIIGEFDTKIDGIQHELLQLRYVLEGELRALEDRINRELQEFATVESESLRKKVRTSGEVQQGSTHSTYFTPLENQLASELVVDFEQWRKDWEPELVRLYAGMMNATTSQMNHVLDGIVEWTSTVFKIETGTFSKIESLDWQDTFYYKIQDYPVFMEIDGLKLFAGVLPKSFLRKRLLNRLIESIESKVDRNCGRLKYEYLYSLQEAHRQFQRHLDQKVEGLTAELRQVLQRALDQRSTLEEGQTPTIHHLEESLSKLQELQEQIEVRM
jgi:GTPase Era involved in 16S rRNA processing